MPYFYPIWQNGSLTACSWRCHTVRTAQNNGFLSNQQCFFVKSQQSNSWSTRMLKLWFPTSNGEWIMPQQNTFVEQNDLQTASKSKGLGCGNAPQGSGNATSTPPILTKPFTAASPIWRGTWDHTQVWLLVATERVRELEWGWKIKEKGFCSTRQCAIMVQTMICWFEPYKSKFRGAEAVESVVSPENPGVSHSFQCDESVGISPSVKASGCHHHTKWMKWTVQNHPKTLPSLL